MHDANITNCNTLPNKVNLYVFGALILNWVGGHVDNADIVIIDKSSMLKGSVELKKKLA
jgi:hypothetical protein